MIPTLTTDRLALRPPRLEDFEPYAATLMSERAIHMGGPFERDAAWCDFCQEVASWHLRGYGAWSIEPREGGPFLGLAILHHEFGDPEHELGWVLTAEAEGRGFATEAARAAGAHAYGPLGWDTAVSYVDPANARSIAVAERLGARLDPEAARPEGYPECLVYRHPGPEALS